MYVSTDRSGACDFVHHHNKTLDCVLLIANNNNTNLPCGRLQQLTGLWTVKRVHEACMKPRREKARGGDELGARALRSVPRRAGSRKTLFT